MSCRLRTLLSAAAPLLATAQSWFHLPEVRGPLGDYTEDELKVIRRVDPDVEGSSTALNSHTNFSQEIQKNGAKRMHNARALTMEEWSKKAGVKIIDPTVRDVYGTNVVLTDHGLLPAAQFEFWASWNLTDRPRKPALLVEDLIEDYRKYVGYLIPKVAPLVAAFREHDLPVFWSNWLRRPDDGLYGSLDRWYGSKGVRDQLNPAYVYAKNGSKPMVEIMPTAEEVQAGRMIHSAHLSKFADVDTHGRSLFIQKLKAAGVDTLVVVGAWTEDCLPATTFEGTDKYNVDMVIVSDGVGTATASHFPALDVMGASSAKLLTSAEVVSYLDKHGSDDAYIIKGTGSVAMAAEESEAASDSGAVNRIGFMPCCALLATVAAGSFLLGRISAKGRVVTVSGEPFLAAV